MSMSYADVISELAMVRDGVLAFTDSHFSTADECSLIEFLCILFEVWCFFPIFLMYFQYESTIIVIMLMNCYDEFKH